MFNLLARPSAGIGVVDGDRRGRGAKTRGFLRFLSSRATLCGNRRGRGAKTHGFLRCLTCSRDPLRESAWSRCKNPWFFAMFNLLARPSAGIGVVEVQKLEVFCDFCGARATLCGDRRGRGAKTRGFLRLLLFELVLGSCRGSRTCSRNRRVAGSIPPWSAGGRRKMQLAF